MYSTIIHQLELFVRKEDSVDLIMLPSYLIKALGVCLLTLYQNQLEISGDYAPKSIKAVVSGSGNSTKEELQQSLSKYLSLSEGFEFANYDESDAVSVVLTYLIKEKMLEAPI